MGFLTRPDDFGVAATTEPVRIKLREREYDLALKEALRDELRLASGATVAVIDCSSVNYLDSTALGCLIELRKQMAQKCEKPRIQLIEVKPWIARIFEITALAKIFEIVPDDMPVRGTASD